MRLKSRLGMCWWCCTSRWSCSRWGYCTSGWYCTRTWSCTIVLWQTTARAKLKNSSCVCGITRCTGGTSGPGNYLRGARIGRHLEAWNWVGFGASPHRSPETTRYQNILCVYPIQTLHTYFKGNTRGIPCCYVVTYQKPYTLCPSSYKQMVEMCTTQ